MEISRVELPTGQVVTVEHPEDWPEYKVTAFAELNAPSAVRTNAPSGTDNKDDDVTTVDAIKLGLARTAMQFIPDTFLISNEELRESIRQANRGNVENAGTFQERMARELAGVPVDAELGYGQEVIAGLADPLNVVGLRGGVKSVLQGLVPTVTASVSGTTGGMAASEIAKDFGAGPLGQELAGALGGGLTAASGGVATTAAISTGMRVAGDIKNRVVGGDTGTLGVASDALANSKVRAEINRIKTTSKPEEVTQAVENLAALKEEIPDLEIGGLVATLVENPIVRDWVRKTTQNNKGFQKELVEKISRDSVRVAERFDKILGESEEIGRPIVAGVAESQLKKTQAALRTTVDRQNKNINNVLDGLTTRLLGTKDIVDVGRVSQKLLNRKEAVVRRAASKLYDQAKSEAKKVTLSDQTVVNLASMFKGIKTSDIFGPESKTAKKLEIVLKPKKSGGEDAESQVKVPKITGEDLISLKKSLSTEVSKLLRVQDRNSEQKQLLDRLFKLKDVVDGVVIKQAEESPKFVKAYRDADEFYYRELGLPMKAEGMREIKTKRFMSGAAQSLMNYEQARDYVNFVGKQGMGVVRHAVRLKADQAGVVDASGVISQNKLDTFRRRNERLIKFAGLTEEFSNTSSKLKTVKNTQARHNEAYNEKSRALTQSFFKSITDNNLSTVVKQMLKPKKRAEYLRDINKLDSAQRDLVMTGIRQEFLAQALQTKGTMKDFINKHAEATNDLFDKNYVGNINKMADLKDLMGQISVLLKDTLGETGVIDTLQDMTGVSIAEYAGTIRNQILSTERKFINLAMKAATTSGKDKYYVKSAEVLLDPDVVAKLANPPEGSLKSWAKDTMQGAGDYLKDVGTYFTQVMQGHLTLATLKSMEAAKDVPTPEEQEQLMAQGAQQ